MRYWFCVMCAGEPVPWVGNYEADDCPICGSHVGVFEVTPEFPRGPDSSRLTVDRLISAGMVDRRPEIAALRERLATERMARQELSDVLDAMADALKLSPLVTSVQILDHVRKLTTPEPP